MKPVATTSTIKTTPSSKVKKVFSCEFFPPATIAGIEKLNHTQQILTQVVQPEYYSVTFGAGGATRDRTLNVVKQLTKKSIALAPHVTCIGSTKTQINDLLAHYKQLGITRLVALRGDLSETGEATKDISYANELVYFIKQNYNTQFKIEVAAYPEYHPEAASPQTDFDHFKNKVSAGADAAITQYFYNRDAYFRFIDKCLASNINIPIRPGIMPMTNYKNLTRFSDSCGAEIPRWIRRQLEAYCDDKASLQAFGLDVVSKLCADLLAQNAPGLHFYTLNQSEAVSTIWQRLNL